MRPAATSAGFRSDRTRCTSPPYHVSPAYARLVNVNNTRLVSSTYINHIYEQTGTPHYVNNRAAAVTSVPQSVFVSGQQVGAHALHVAPALLAASLVTAAAPAIAPSRQSVLGTNDGRLVARPPAALLRRTVVAHHPPPRAPATFDEQLAAIQANGGRPLARAELAQLQPQTADASVRVVAIAGPVVTHAGAAAQSGRDARWRRQRRRRPRRRSPSASGSCSTRNCQVQRLPMEAPASRARMRSYRPSLPSPLPPRRRSAAATGAFATAARERWRRCDACAGQPGGTAGLPPSGQTRQRRAGSARRTRARPRTARLRPRHVPRRQPRSMRHRSRRRTHRPRANRAIRRRMGTGIRGTGW